VAVGGSHHCRCSSVKRYVVDRGCCMDRLCILIHSTMKKLDTAMSTDTSPLSFRFESIRWLF